MDTLDVASSRRMCMTIIEDAQEIMRGSSKDMDGFHLLTWWTK